MPKVPGDIYILQGLFFYLIYSYLLYELVYTNMKYTLECILQTNLATPAAVV